MHWVRVLVALPGATAIGQPQIVNACGYSVYYMAAGPGWQSGVQELPSPSYNPRPGSGMSIKLSPQLNGEVTQFEYSWDSGKVHYDLSNINGAPFAAAGMSLVPSVQNDSRYPTCVSIDCPAGQEPCVAAYNQPNDIRTHVCHEDVDLTLTLCPAGRTPIVLPINARGYTNGSNTHSNTHAAVHMQPRYLVSETKQSHRHQRSQSAVRNVRHDLVPR